MGQLNSNEAGDNFDEDRPGRLTGVTTSEIIEKKIGDIMINDWR